jgi:hypothetical protein
MPGNRAVNEEEFMRSRSTPARERTFGRFLRHIVRRNPWHSRVECERIAALTFPARPVRSIAPDTLILHRQPAQTWPDGERSPEDFVAIVLHRVPFERPANRYPVDGSDRTVYVGNRSRAEAIGKLAAHV